jgi:hypothetical protein
MHAQAIRKEEGVSKLTGRQKAWTSQQEDRRHGQANSKTGGKLKPK